MNTPSPFRFGGRRSGRLDPALQYVVDFEARLRLLLLANGSFRDLDDVVSHEKIRLYERLAIKMAAYPNPEVYAAERARSGRAAIGYQRGQNAQAGTGSYGQRSVSGGNSLIAAESGRVERDFADRIIEHDFADRVVERDTATAMIRAALLGLPADQKELLMRVGGYAFTKSEAAAHMGIARETASRKYHAATKAIGSMPPC